MQRQLQVIRKKHTKNYNSTLTNKLLDLAQQITIKKNINLNNNLIQEESQEISKSFNQKDIEVLHKNKILLLRKPLVLKEMNQKEEI